MTPKIRADRLGDIVRDIRVRGQAVLCLVSALVKCTRIYFSGKQCTMFQCPL